MSLYEQKSVYYVTTGCRHQQHYFESDAVKRVLCNTLLNCNALHDAEMLGYVIMPNHLHVLLCIRNKEALSRYMHCFKTYSSAAIRQLLIMEDPVNALLLAYHRKRQRYKVWEDGFSVLETGSGSLARQMLDRMHNNPLQQHWQLAGCAEAYPFSSAGFYANGKKGVMEVVPYGRYFGMEETQMK